MELNGATGGAVRRRREALRLSMRRAARAGGISVTAWSDVEAGRRPMSPATERAVAAALAWPLTWTDDVAAGREPEPTSAVGAGDYVSRNEFDRLESEVTQLRRDLRELALAARHFLRAEVEARNSERQSGEQQGHEGRN